MYCDPFKANTNGVKELCYLNKKYIMLINCLIKVFMDFFCLKKDTTNTYKYEKA